VAGEPNPFEIAFSLRGEIDHRDLDMRTFYRLFLRLIFDPFFDRWLPIICVYIRVCWVRMVYLGPLLDGFGHVHFARGGARISRLVPHRMLPESPEIFKTESFNGSTSKLT
jgi:hypothetical protein